MKYILWKRLKTKQVNEFESENIQEVLDYAIMKGYEYTGLSYIGQFHCFSNGNHSFSIQGQHSIYKMVLSYDPKIGKINSYEQLTGKTYEPQGH